MHMKRMLIAETDCNLSASHHEWFAKENFEINHVKTGCDVWKFLSSDNYDVLLLDHSMCGADVIYGCRRYRECGGLAAIILMSRQPQSETVEQALIEGADDYVSFDVSLPELSARIKAVLRRPSYTVRKVLRVAEIALHLESGQVTRMDEPVKLHPMEFNLLEFFMQHPDQTFTGRALWERLWAGKSAGSQETVRTHIKTLRQKLSDNSGTSPIVTVRGRGYRLESAPRSSRELREESTAELTTGSDAPLVTLRIS